MAIKKLCAACCKPALMQTRLTLSEGHACTVLPKNGHACTVLPKMAIKKLRVACCMLALTWTWPTFLASENGHLKVVRFLLQACEDANNADNDGRTPMHYAAGNGHEEVVLCLMHAGAV
ncbi:unnamed protein product [Effrenium voratum]|nr:unnamed protein product [Effrenium voratum]